MAEINVQQKERQWWPWLVGAAMLVAVVVYFAQRDDRSLASRENGMGRDTSSAAGTLAPDMADSAAWRRDSIANRPPR